MSRIRVACCSCFIEKCVFFCKTKCNFEDLMSTNSELFIKETRQHSLFPDSPVIYTEYVIACLDCFTFQLWNLSIEDIRIFDTIDIAIHFVLVKNIAMMFLPVMDNLQLKMRF